MPSPSTFSITIYEGLFDGSPSFWINMPKGSMPIACKSGNWATTIEIIARIDPFEEDHEAFFFTTVQENQHIDSTLLMNKSLLGIVDLQTIEAPVYVFY